MVVFATPPATKHTWHAPIQRHHQRRTGVQMQAFQRNLALLSAVFQQARNEAGWVRDLVEPLVQLGPPPPLKDTLPPQLLGDPDSKFVDVEGVTLHYKEIVLQSPSSTTRSNGTTTLNGSQATVPQPIATKINPTTILLLHGFNGSTFNWRFLMQPLAESLRSLHGPSPQAPLRVIAFDRPPFGLSQRPQVSSQGAPQGAPDFNPYTSEGAARLGVGLLKALGAESALVVGHSAGAGVAMEMAVRYPTSVDGLVFVCPALPDDSGKLISLNLGSQLRFGLTRAILSQDASGIRYIRRVIGKRRDEVLQGKVQLFADGTEMSADAIDGYLRPMRAQDWDVGMLETMRSFSLNKNYDYGSLDKAVLFVQGEKDEPLATLARKVSAALAKRQGVTTTYTELPGVGHIPMEETVEGTMKAINDWLCAEYGQGVNGAAVSAQ